jgi:glycosyltransferase involved in cell wall biosynthesis
MRILIIISSLEHGGAEKQAVLDANFLLKNGNEVTIAFRHEGDLFKLLDKNVKTYKFMSISSMLSSLELFWHLIFNKYSVIHTHMFWAAKVAAISGKLTGHKVIFNEHGMGLWRKWYHIKIVRFISRYAEKIIVSCDASRKIRLERENLEKNKLITIYNSFELDMINRDSESPVFEPGKKFIIGFVGRFHKVKRLEIFLELAERLLNRINEFRIILVGDGEERKKIEEEVRKKNLSEYFYLPGFDLDPTKYYSIFDVFVLPSRIEGFSVALLEAEASGIPAIAFDVGGNAEIIKNNITGFLLPDLNIDILVEKIIYLYENPQKRKEMGNEARNYIKSNFSNELRIKKLEKLYQGIIKKNSDKN